VRTVSVRGSSPVATAGPIGQKVSNPFARTHWANDGSRWMMSATVTSFAQV
jgi:hypothetical protein